MGWPDGRALSTVPHLPRASPGCSCSRRARTPDAGLAGPTQARSCLRAKPLCDVAALKDAPRTVSGIWTRIAKAVEEDSYPSNLGSTPSGFTRMWRSGSARGLGPRGECSIHSILTAQCRRCGAASHKGRAGWIVTTDCDRRPAVVVRLQCQAPRRCVAQFGSAPRSGRGSQRFKSSHADRSTRSGNRWLKGVVLFAHLGAPGSTRARPVRRRLKSGSSRAPFMLPSASG